MAQRGRVGNEKCKMQNAKCKMALFLAFCSMTYLILALGICASSSAAVLIRLCEAPALVVAVYRLGMASVLILPFAVLRYSGQIRALPTRDRLALAGSGVLLGFHFAFWISSLSHTSVASSVLLVSTNPIWVGLGGWLLLKEGLSLRMAAGTAVALAGTVLVSLEDWGHGQHAFYGDALALAGAVAVSGYFLIGRRQRQRLGLIPYIAVVYTTAAVVLLALALAAGHSLTGYDDRTYVFFALLALGPQLLGHSSFNYALKRMPPALIALALLAEPIGASALAYLVLDEMPTAVLFLSAAVILTGIATAAWPRGRRTV